MEQNYAKGIIDFHSSKLFDERLINKLCEAAKNSDIPKEYSPAGLLIYAFKMEMSPHKSSALFLGNDNLGEIVREAKNGMMHNHPHISILENSRYALICYLNGLEPDGVVIGPHLGEAILKMTGNERGRLVKFNRYNPLITTNEIRNVISDRFGENTCNNLKYAHFGFYKLLIENEMKGLELISGHI